jgi:hypothetical protein
VIEAQRLQSTPAPQDTLGQKFRKDRKNISVRLSVKSDLTAAEMGEVSKVLLLDNPVSFFSSNFQTISALWISLVQRATSGGVIHFIVTAFDEVHRLAKGGRGPRLPSRFSYLQLKYAFDALNAAVTRDRVRGLGRRKRGYSNASLAIDIYLNAKRNASGENLSRENLSEYRRVSTRWYQLIRTSLLQLSVYSDVAETIVYVALLRSVLLILNSLKQQQLNKARQIAGTCFKLNFVWPNCSLNGDMITCTESDIRQIGDVIGQSRIEVQS